MIMAGTAQTDRKGTGAEGYLVDADEHKKPLIIAFGGIAGQFHQPLFEFKKFLQANLDCHFIYLRDMKQSWYHQGVLGLGDTIPQVAQRLQEIIGTINHSKVLTIGGSMGGYAALLFGHLVGADRMLAFSPQTFICKELMDRHGDHRLDEPLHRMWSSCDLLYPDLKEVPLDPTRAHIIYGTWDIKDVIHSERMSVRTTAVPGDHGVVKQMRNDGRLIKLIKKELGNGDLPAPM